MFDRIISLNGYYLVSLYYKIMTGGKKDPSELQIRADQNTPPFTYDKEPIVLIATRENRKKKEYLYIIKNKKWIVFNETKNSPMFMKIAPDSHSNSTAVLMPVFYERFTKPDKVWLELNRYILVSG